MASGGNRVGPNNEDAGRIAKQGDYRTELQRVEGWQIEWATSAQATAVLERGMTRSHSHRCRMLERRSGTW